MTTLSTDRLIIRNFNTNDWSDLYEMIRQYQATKYARFDQPWPTQAGEIKGVVEWFAAGDSFLAVCLKATSKLIAGRSIGSFQTTPEGKPIEFLGASFAISRDEWIERACGAGFPRSLRSSAVCQSDR